MATFQPPRHEANGPVRRFRWSHVGREDIIIEVETANQRCIQMLFGPQFNFNRSGFHGSWFALNSTTVFIRGLRYKGANAKFKHDMIFLKVTNAMVNEWRCTTFPITITQLDNVLPRSWGRLTSLEDIASGVAQQVWIEYAGSSATGSSPATTSSASSSCSDIVSEPEPEGWIEYLSSSSVTGSSTGATVSASSSSSTSSWTWEDFVNRPI